LFWNLDLENRLPIAGTAIFKLEAEEISMIKLQVFVCMDGRQHGSSSTSTTTPTLQIDP
jgi:hypothetical protein